MRARLEEDRTVAMRVGRHSFATRASLGRAVVLCGCPWRVNFGIRFSGEIGWNPVGGPPQNMLENSLRVVLSLPNFLDSIVWASFVALQIAYFRSRPAAPSSRQSSLWE